MLLLRLGGKPPLSVKRRGASGAGGGHCLPVMPIDNIARREDTRYRSPCRRLLHEQVAVIIGGKLTLEEIGPRIMTDRHEHPRNGQNALRAGVDIAQPEAGEPVLPDHLHYLAVPGEPALR